MSKYTIGDLETGKLPFLTTTKEFRTTVVKMSEINLLNFLHMPGAPIIKVGRKYLINTKKMIEFLENQSVNA